MPKLLSEHPPMWSELPKTKKSILKPQLSKDVGPQLGKKANSVLGIIRKEIASKTANFVK